MSPANAAPAKIGWLAALSPRFLAAPSVMALIAANLFPLYGVLFWDWDLYGLMVLYWMETGIIGFFAIIQMAMAAGLFAIILVPFFVLHFGGFMAGHIFFLTALFGGGRPDAPAQIPYAVWSVFVEHGLWVALAALIISHSFSFVHNVWRPRRAEMHDRVAPSSKTTKKLEGKNVQSIMLAPYGRIVVMHLTIIFGAFLIHALRTKIAAFALLIALKIAFDVASHVRKNYAHFRLSTQ
jgi:hypothetical protein